MLHLIWFFTADRPGRTAGRAEDALRAVGHCRGAAQQAAPDRARGQRRLRHRLPGRSRRRPRVRRRRRSLRHRRRPSARRSPSRRRQVLAQHFRERQVRHIFTFIHYIFINYKIKKCFQLIDFNFFV